MESAPLGLPQGPVKTLKSWLDGARTFRNHFGAVMLCVSKRVLPAAGRFPRSGPGDWDPAAIARKCGGPSPGLKKRRNQPRAPRVASSRGCAPSENRGKR